MDISKYKRTFQYIFFLLALLFSVFKADAQSITLVSPNGGEVWQAYTSHNIVWKGNNISGSIYIEYSLDAGQNWNYLYMGSGADTGGYYSWSLPFIQSANAKIRVTYWNNPSVLDVSDNVFAITMPDFAVVYPNGGETFYASQTKNIQWIANNSSSLLIEYSTDNGSTWSTVANNVNASLQSYQWTVPNTLSSYCLVRITDINNSQNIDRSNQNFTIAPLPTLDIVYPNGGEVFEVGDTLPVTWSGTNLNGSINFEFSVNNGQSWSYMATVWGNQTGGVYNWTVPNNLTTHALIRVKFFNVPTVADTCGNTFSIVLPTFALLYPLGNESLYPGQAVDLKWVAANATTIKLEYTIDNGASWIVINNSIAASLGVYSWTVPNTPSGDCLVRLTDVGNPSATDISNQTFTINPLPEITLLNPNGGQIILVGSNYTIEWTGHDIQGSIFIEYSVNSGSTWNNIGWAYGNSNGGTFSWTVPDSISNQCLIRVSFWDYQVVNDVSNANFAIQLPSFILNAPNGNETLYPNNNFNIQWSAVNSTLIRIEFSNDNGVTWQLVADNVNAQQNSYVWTVPNTPSQHCLIKITDVLTPTLSDVSNSTFKINPIPTILLVSPNGGESFAVGDTCTINWTGTNLNGGIYIEASYNNGSSWQNIGWVYGTVTSGSYKWAVTNNITTQAFIRVKYWNYPSVFDKSDAPFSITPPSFAIVYPHGNEMFYPTNLVQIQWYASSITAINIDYSVDNGSTWISEVINYNATLGSYQWTVPNLPSTQCKIKITDASNSNHYVISNSFTIKVLPTVHLESPNGGETITAGSLYNIVWTGTNIENGVNIEYSSDNGQNWTYINYMQSSPSGGNYSWQVPYITSTSVLVRLRLWNISNASDQSDAVFSIQLPNFVLIQPNGGQSFYPTQQANIQWSAVNSTYISIEYSTDNGSVWQTIEDSVVAALNSYAWTVPNTPSTNCLVRIKDIDNTSNVRVSSSTFTILQMPALQLISPNGGEVYIGGQTETIQWSGTNIAGNVYLEYSTDGGATWQYLSWASSNSNGGTYLWVVPYLTSSSVMVKAKFWTLPSVVDQSAGYFTIQIPAFVLISPDGNENFYPGNTTDIKWNAINSAFIKIEYSVDNGLNYTVIADSVIASSGVYSWSVPNTPSTQCKVKITDLDDSLTYDISSYVFRIYPVPTISIITPNGGELLTAGADYNVQWSGTNINSSVYLDYSLNGGGTWQYLGWGYGTLTGGNYTWSVPFYQSSDVKVRAKLWDIQSVHDESNDPFAIVLPPFALISPNGGYSYYPESSVNIQWIAQNSTKIKIDYTINNALSWITITDSVDASLNNYSWTIPNTPSNACLIRILDISDTSVVDISDNFFVIKVLPTISLVQPNGGEVWTSGDTTQIIWTGTNLDGNVILEFTTNNWISSAYIGGEWGWTTGGSYPISVPFINTTNAKVRVRILEAPTVKDESDTTFSIVFPPFSLVSPNGQEQYYPTNTVQIKWFASGVSNVRIDYSINNGLTWINIEQSLNGSNGFYDWTIPNTPSTQCLVKVSDVNNPSYFDVSNNIFTIKTLPTIHLTSPVGGEVLVSGTTYTISWTGTNLTNAVYIYYSVDLGYSWNYVNEIWSMNNGASYQWFVPYTPTNNALVRVFLYDASSVFSQSNAVFTIQNPSLSLIFPNGNETYFPYNKDTIKWVCTDSTLLKIEYTVDNDTTWNTIAANVHAGLGRYVWTIPNTPSPYCKVKIINQNNTQSYDLSDTVFEIHALPQLSVVSPNGGEILTGGTVLPVFWTGHDLTDPVIIEYTGDNWATSQMINWKYGNPDGDSINWVVPFTPTTKARIKVYYNDAPIIADQSDTAFTIVNPPFALVSPLGGENFFPTNDVYIQWITTNTMSLRIEYSTDNGNTWLIIATNVNPLMGIYDWIVPNTPSTTCKVKISDEYNSSVSSQSIYNFTIRPFPSINIVSPNGGEQFVAGNTYPVIWTGTNLNGGVRLEYSVDNGLTWVYIQNFFNMPYGGTYYWQVPFQITTQALVRASFLSITQMVDVSNNTFSIINPSFALIAPNSPGLSFYPSTQMNIQWIATQANYVKILFSYNNGQTWSVVDNSVDALLGSYLWTVPNLPSSTCRIRIVDVDNNLTYDTSDDPFTIQFLPYLNLINPNGGEDYVTSDTINIKWTGAYLTGGVYLDYSVDTGATWHNITSKWGNPNGDHYIWTAPNILARVLVKITYIDILSISSQSDSLFSICFNPQLHVIATPFVCQPNTVDISNYFNDNANATGTVSYWMDSLITQPVNDSHHVANSGLYYILKQTIYGTCRDTLPIEVVVGTTPSAPLVVPSVDMCSADTGNYIHATGQNIQWYGNNLLSLLILAGDSINTSHFISDTVIYVTQYISPACPSLPATTNVFYHLTPTHPVVTMPPPYCAGDSISNLHATGSNINWYSDSHLTLLAHQGNMLSLNPLYHDTAFYVTQNQDNCPSIATFIPFTINPKPPKPTISLVGLAIVSSSNTGNQWFNNQNIPQSTNQYFTPLVDGFYYVVVTINNCTSDTSDIVYYYITGSQTAETVNKEIFIYPNPFNDHFNVIHLSEKDASYEIELFSITGQVFLDKNISFDSLNHEYIVNIADLPKGMCFVRLKNKDEVFIYKIVKQ